MTAKPGQLKIYWSKREKDIMLDWGGAGATKADGWWLWGWLSFFKGDTKKTFMEELEQRGFDKTTLKISVERSK